MNVKVNDAPKSQKELLIELPYDVLEKAMDEECARVSKDAKIPGFRPGNAPKEIVKKQNMHRIRSAAIEKVIVNTMREVLVANNINPIYQPEVKDVVIEEGNPITFTLMADVYPEFTITRFGGFEFERTNIKVTEADIENTIKNLQERYAEFKKVTEEREAGNEDEVSIDFEGKLDGKPFDGGSAKKHLLVLGSNQFIPGFEDGVVGMKVGDVKDIGVTFPEDYTHADLAGKDVIFTVTLHQIREKQVPELNDEFAKQVNYKIETVEDLKKAIEKDLQFEADQYVKFRTFTTILDKIVEENPFDVPVSILNEQAEQIATQNLQQYYEMGINPEMFGLTPKSMAPRFIEEAEKQVKRALSISKISEEQQIVVTDEDITKEIERVSEITGNPVDELRKELSNPEQMVTLQNNLLSDNVYRFLCEQNILEEKTITREDFEKQQAEERKKINEKAKEEREAREKTEEGEQKDADKGDTE